MKVCLSAGNLNGGYGVLTKDIALGLAENGVDVSIVLKEPGNEKLEGVSVYNLNKFYKIWPRGLAIRLSWFRGLPELYRKADADIYNNTIGEPELSYIAKRAMPSRKRVIYFQDPRNDNDWKTINSLPRIDKREDYRFWGRPVEIFHKRNRFAVILDNYLMKKSLNNIDAVFYQARYLDEKTRRMYRYKGQGIFMPNPIRMPRGRIKKARDPTVCFLARLAMVKRPWIFFSLAKAFPDVEFITMGGMENEERTEMLRKRYKDVKNLKILGPTYGEKKNQILESSWILINTSIHECLPVSFLEAFSYKCAVLSSQNPDNLTRSYGCFTGDIGDRFALSSFVDGLNILLKSRRKKGELGYRYVKKTHEFDKVIKQHIRIYEGLL